LSCQRLGVRAGSPIEHPCWNFQPTFCLRPIRRAAKDDIISLVDGLMNADAATKPGMMPIKNLAKNGPVGVLERPHQALNMQYPAQRYRPSPRPYRGLPDIDYPFHDRAATVTTCGRICFNRQKINLSQVFAGQTVGIKQTDDRIWLVSFMDYDLGYFDDETCRLEPLANPFGPKVLPMSSE